MKRLELLLSIAVLALVILGCSKDDEMRPLTVTGSDFSFDTLNTCDIGSGDFATLFNFHLELPSAPTIEVGGVEFDLEWSNGNETENILEDDLVMTGTTISYDWCFRFGSTDWFELRQTLVDPDGKALSNEVTLRVNKPAGAN